MKIKELLKEAMTKEQAETIFTRYGAKNPLHYSSGDLKKIYLALVKKNHPDTGGALTAMQEINAAYDILKKIKTGLEGAGFANKDVWGSPSMQRKDQDARAASSKAFWDAANGRRKEQAAKDYYPDGTPRPK